MALSPGPQEPVIHCLEIGFLTGTWGSAIKLTCLVSEPQDLPASAAPVLDDKHAPKHPASYVDAKD